MNDSRDPLYPTATLSNSRILGSLGLAHGNTASWNSAGGAKPDWLKRVGARSDVCLLPSIVQGALLGMRMRHLVTNLPQIRHHGGESGGGKVQ